MDERMPGCVRCPFEAAGRLCQDVDGKAPPFCPTANQPGVIERVLEELKKPGI